MVTGVPKGQTFRRGRSGTVFSNEAGLSAVQGVTKVLEKLNLFKSTLADPFYPSAVL